MFGLQETWDIDSDYCLPFFPDHTIYSCYAKKSSVGGRPLGGVIVGIKNSLSKYVNRIAEDFKFGILIRLDKTLFNFSRDVIFINVYVPPENSPAYDGERGSLSVVLESCFAELSTLNVELILSGDLNARTANLNDYIVCKDDVKELQEIYELIDGDIGIERISEDKITNKFGHELLNFCKVHSLYIANGRFGDLSSMSTFINRNGQSLIDYFVVSKNVFWKIYNVSTLISTESCHVPVELIINEIPVKCNSSKYNQQKESVKLDHNNANDYLACLTESALGGGFETIELMIDDKTSNITEIVQKLENVIIDCSSTFRKKRGHFGNQSKPWFDKDCKHAKKESKRLLKCFRSSRSEYNLNEYINSKQKYKELCKTKSGKYNRLFLEKLDSSAGNSSQFWGQIRRLTGKQRTEPNISTSDWYKHFKSLFSASDDDAGVTLTHDTDNIGGIDDIEDTLFNSPITYDEIADNINHLNATVIKL